MNTSGKIQAIRKMLQQTKDNSDLDCVLSELLTESEIEKMYERVQIVECLHKGLSQRETSKKTTAAIATVTRGASLLKQNNSKLAEVIERNQRQAWWRQLFWGA